MLRAKVGRGFARFFSLFRLRDATCPSTLSAKRCVLVKGHGKSRRMRRILRPLSLTPLSKRSQTVLCRQPPRRERVEVDPSNARSQRGGLSSDCNPFVRLRIHKMNFEGFMSMEGRQSTGNGSTIASKRGDRLELAPNESRVAGRTGKSVIHLERFHRPHRKGRSSTS